MFQNAALDVAIGLALMYSVLSLVCTVVNEFIATRLSLRSKSLAAGLAQLLDDPTVRTAFYNHGLVSGTSHLLQEASPLMIRVPAAAAATPAAAPVAQTVGTHPSYLATETFVLALLGSLAPQQPGHVTPGIAHIQNAIGNLPDSKVKSSLQACLIAAQGDFDRFRESVAKWFDDSMDRLGGAYKRNLKFIAILVGCFVAVVINADSFAVSRALWSDANLRAQMVQVAGETVKSTPSSAPPAATEKTGAGTQPPASGTAADADPLATPANSSPPASVARISDTLAQANESLRPLPIGWSSCTLPQTGRRSDVAKMPAMPVCFPEVEWATAWYYIAKMLGWFSTGLALSLGAPFWFDTLSKFVNIRGAGARPERQTKG